MITYQITVKHFNYALLMQDHLSSFFYALLVVMGLSFYIIKDQFARIGILLMVIGMGIYIQRIDWLALPAIGVLATLIYYGQNAVSRVFRGWMFLLGIIASIYALHYSIPGITNWQVVKTFQFSYKAPPYSMMLSVQAFLVGLFFLWFSTASLMNEGSWKPILKIFWLPAILGIAVLAAVGLYTHFVMIDFKPTNFYFLWAFHNLFFVCVAEEAIFRGMIQHFLTLQLQTVQGGKWLALVLASVAFGLFHFKGGWIYMGLAAVAGLFYGYAYLRTKKIESSILVHFCVNSAHFLLFSYPALKTV